MQRVNRIMTPKKPIVGVDLGSTSIKLVKIKKSGSGAMIEGVVLHPLNPAALPADENEKREVLIRELKNAAFGLKLKSTLSSLGVAGSSVIVREAKLPALPPAELARTLAFEAEPFIPYDIREVNLDYHVLREVSEEGQQKYEVILVAAKKDLLDSRLSMAVAAGLKPVIVDVNAFALVNLIDYIPSAKEETVAVANIGATITNLAIIEKGSPRVVRDVAVAGNAFTRALQNALNVDEATAEKLKCETGLILSEEQKEKLNAAGETQKVQVSNTLYMVASDLISEIHRSTEFYMAHGQDRTLHRIYLTGGGAILKDLAAFATAQLKVPVEVLNPLQVLQVSSLSIPTEMGPALSIACGLGLRGWNDWIKQ